MAELPTASTRLVGRDTDVRAVMDLLASKEACLLTVFASLAPLHELELVVPAIAHVLGLSESAQQPLRQVLHAYVRPRNVLFVLDNFERLIGAAAEGADLLAAGGRTSVLAASRSPLGSGASGSTQLLRWRRGWRRSCS